MQRGNRAYIIIYINAGSNPAVAYLVTFGGYEAPFFICDIKGTYSN